MAPSPIPSVELPIDVSYVPPPRSARWRGARPRRLLALGALTSLGAGAAVWLASPVGSGVIRWLMD